MYQMSGIYEISIIYQMSRKSYPRQEKGIKEIYGKSGIRDKYPCRGLKKFLMSGL